MNLRKKKKYIIFIIALFVLYLVIYIVPKITGVFVSSYTVVYGELMFADEADGYFVKNETVYLANDGGKTNYYIDEDALVRKGTAIMEVSDNVDKELSEKYKTLVKELGSKAIKTSDYKAETDGLVAYYCDGAEAKLTPETMENKKKAFFDNLQQSDVLSLKSDKIIKGQPAFKIVDRTKWYIVCYLDKKKQKEYEPGDSININLDKENIDGKVFYSKVEKDKAKIIIESDTYYKDLTQTRVAPVKIIKSVTRGLIIENSSIKEQKGKKGVYVKDKVGDYNFTPINVISTDGKQSVVSKGSYYDQKGNYTKTINTYDEVLKNPR